MDGRMDVGMGRELPDAATVEAALALAVGAVGAQFSPGAGASATRRASVRRSEPAVAAHRPGPAGSDAQLRCGAATFHRRALGAGLAVRGSPLPNPADPDHLASIEILDSAVDEQGHRAGCGHPAPAHRPALVLVHGRCRRRHRGDGYAGGAQGAAAPRRGRGRPGRRGGARCAGTHQRPGVPWPSSRCGAGGTATGRRPGPQHPVGGATGQVPGPGFANPVLDQPADVGPATMPGWVLVLATATDDPPALLAAGATGAVLLTTHGAGPWPAARSPNRWNWPTPRRCAPNCSTATASRRCCLRIGWAALNADLPPATPRAARCRRSPSGWTARPCRPGLVRRRTLFRESGLSHLADHPEQDHEDPGSR